MKQTYFIRLNVNKQGVSHTLLIPVTCQSDVNTIVDAWIESNWSVEVIDTPFPGTTGVNASEIGVHANV